MVVFFLLLSESALTGIFYGILAFLVTATCPFLRKKKVIINWIIKSDVFTIIIQSDVNMSKPQQNLLSILGESRMKDTMFRSVRHPSTLKIL